MLGFLPGFSVGALGVGLLLLMDLLGIRVLLVVASLAQITIVHLGGLGLDRGALGLPGLSLGLQVLHGDAGRRCFWLGLRLLGLLLGFAVVVLA